MTFRRAWQDAAPVQVHAYAIMPLLTFTRAGRRPKVLPGSRLTALHVPEDLVIRSAEPPERLRVRVGAGARVRVTRARARAVSRLHL